MKRVRSENPSSPSSEAKKPKGGIMDANAMRALMEEMSKKVTDNINSSLGGQISHLTARMGNLENTTRFAPIQGASEIIELDSSNNNTPDHSNHRGGSTGRGRGRGRAVSNSNSHSGSGARGRNHSASDSSVASSGGRGGRGRGRGGSNKKKRKNEYITGMKRDDFEKMMSNVVLNYDSAKEVAAREIILKGMEAGNDLETATTHIKLIDPSFVSFEIDEVQRFSKADATGVPPLKVTLKRKAMATRLNDLIELAGEEGAPWAQASLPFLVRQKNRLVLKDIGDLNSRLPVNPSKHWEKRVVGGHILKRYKPNPKFNKEVVAPNLTPIPGSSGVTSEQARLAMQNIDKILSQTGAGASGATSGTEDMEQDNAPNPEDPDIENWTPEYREKIRKLLHLPEESESETDSTPSPAGSQKTPPKKKSPRPTRNQKK